MRKILQEMQAEALWKFEITPSPPLRGLDRSLAVKIMIDQGIPVTAVPKLIMASKILV